MSDHLTDDQLQQLLDGSLSNGKTIASHLGECAECQSALDSYKALYAGLKEEIDFSLSADFADSVIEKIPELTDSPASPATIFKISDGVIGFATIAALVAAAIYFLDLLAIGTATRLWSIETFASATAILSVVKQFLSGFGLSPLMVLFAIVTISAIAIIDRIVVTMKRGRGPVTYSI